MRTRRSRSSRGFTIIELMVVIAVIGLLAAIAVPYYFRTLQKGKESRLKHDLRVMRDLIQQYKVDRKRCPDSLQILVDDGYLREIPADPITETSESWIEEPCEADPDDPEAESGVDDVRSGAEGLDSEGVEYGTY